MSKKMIDEPTDESNLEDGASARLKLKHFIGNPLPAAAILLYSRQASSRLRAEPRRTKILHSTKDSQSDDMIEWAATALKTPFSVDLLSSEPRSECCLFRPNPNVRASVLKEVFIARWLNCDISLPLSSIFQERQRRGAENQNGKRKKQLELGELLRLQRLPESETEEGGGSPFRTPAPASSFEGPVSHPRSAESRTASNANRDRSGVKARLAPVGGTTKILCHASAFVGAYTYVFGGLTQHGCSDALWSLDPCEGGWRQVLEMTEVVGPVGALVAGETLALGIRPCRRYNHTLVGWRNYLVVYGGDGAPGYLDDLWYFDTLEATWDRISLLKEQKSSRPGARAGHSATVWENQMIVFGGWRGSDGFCDVWSCDLERREWNLLFGHVCWGIDPCDNGLEIDPTVEGFKMSNTQSVPFARHWHVSAVWNGYLYVHGGYGFSGVLGQLWRFHLVNHQWEHVKAKGRAPAPRCRHSGSVINQNRWILLGGKDALGSYFNDIFIFDFESNTWKEIQLLSPPLGNSWWNSSEVVRQMPTLHCQASSYDSKRGLLVITGGCDGECTSLDSTILVKRSSSASLLFSEWRIRCPENVELASLPAFIHSHPKPYAELFLQFL
eukprot:Gregarina_sp_Poly_1__7445@NODE_413_length_8753_cov_95_009440_g329_i1_p2_GENE_NODE_413_length_8753_cov_95_009440_g329_i1NODE_413_length_8753_cov_95_009440_g329_i1_p2_ORF_typecomplete_len645_score76_31Kelch_4/PF13418_6/0_0012Kelch_4/PF13418_6/1_8e09Kelch_4/PF13418_6/4_1e07Kelch_4/PF13418_6/1_8e07Kelch_4/PF13418_6/5_8e11Kelch_4/PF13418_6/1_6e02Kelch_6/PF13964_6/0_00011Kelch_6/PF13964_6/1_6e08Kelch_6/PF13964_6/1_1e07Kelch_6/PF13964_6/6e08Kelch_6/PF13964_6/2_1e07Kelch_6/PF13964_6/1_3e03Kelch_3/PF1341